MGLIDNVIDMTVDAFRFKDTIFYKANSTLQSQYDALTKLNNEFPGNDDLMHELYIVKKGLVGEDEIAYQLKKSHLGMYVLRDLKFKYQDLSAQIDYIIITPVFTYYVECKNLIGNVTVNEKGDFIREYSINGKKVKKGIYSPLRQVEAQREVFRKIWEANSSKLKKLIASSKFEYYRKVLVVAANQETILNTNRAPKDIKYNVIRADSLINRLEYDFNHRGKDEVLSSQKDMQQSAQLYIDLSVKDDIDYYEFYKNKFNLGSKEMIVNDDLRDRLIKLRKERSTQMGVPAFYIFTNEELDKLLELRPKNIEELKNMNVLSSIKIRVHGETIINEINLRTK